MNTKKVSWLWIRLHRNECETNIGFGDTGSDLKCYLYNAFMSYINNTWSLLGGVAIYDTPFKLILVYRS